ncbi:hypothetical protein C0J52_26974 [Blattella germanica]|nr:hypothetical protein C0J52_26974 [Blattella germanica]
MNLTDILPVVKGNVEYDIFLFRHIHCICEKIAATLCHYGIHSSEKYADIFYFQIFSNSFIQILIFLITGFLTHLMNYFSEKYEPLSIQVSICCVFNIAVCLLTS